MHEWMIAYSAWCLRMHRELPWWSPILCAVYTGSLLWVMTYPDRASDMERIGSRWQVHGPGIDLVFQIGFWSLIAYEALWFALPYPGTELLFMILALPFACLYLGPIAWVQVVYRAFSWVEHEERWEYGMTYVEWQWYLSEREKLQSNKALLQVWTTPYDGRVPSDNDASEDLEAMAKEKRRRFRVLNGKKEGGS